jgi:hypothetical protein
MLKRWLSSFLKTLISTPMSKKTNQITVYGTKEGKLFIKPSELFARPEVQKLIEKINNAQLLQKNKPSENTAG